MAFLPSRDFLQEMTSRTWPETQRKVSAYAHGNKSAESIIRTKDSYRLRKPVYSSVLSDRDRNAQGALADITALSADTASIQFRTVNRLDDKVAQAQIDDDDVDYVAGLGVSLEGMRSDISRKLSEWADDTFWAAALGSIPAAQETALGAGGGYDISRGRFGADDAAEIAAGKAIYDFVQDIPLMIANANIDPATGLTDTTSNIAVEMPPAGLAAVIKFMLDEWGSTDEIVTQGIDRTGARSSERWRGEFKNTVSAFVNTQSSFKPTAAGTANGHIVALQSGVTYDSPMKLSSLLYSGPDGNTVKHTMNQRIHLWYALVAEDRIWAKNFDSVA